MATESTSIYDSEFFAAWETFADQIQLVFQYDGPEAEAQLSKLSTFLRRADRCGG
jgi:hypothetical protein